MNKTVIWIIILALVIVGGFWWWSVNQDDSLDLTETEEETVEEEMPIPGEETDEMMAEEEVMVKEVTINYTQEGFQPSSVSVSGGTKVTFVNQSSGLFWLASDPHPTHTNLPSFDSKKGVVVGESYSFTFESSGDWGFHNHLNPSHTGKVTVN